MFGSILFWRKRTQRRHCNLSRRTYLGSSAVAGFKASYFIGLPAHHASENVKRAMSGPDCRVQQIPLSTGAREPSLSPLIA